MGPRARVATSFLVVQSKKKKRERNQHGGLGAVPMCRKRVGARRGLPGGRRLSALFAPPAVPGSQYFEAPIRLAGQEGAAVRIASAVAIAKI